MSIDYEHFKKKLEAEKIQLEEELSEVAERNPDAPSDWIPKAKDRDVSQADDNTVADGIEDYDENVAILNTLETRYRDIISGLDKIKHGTFGICQECGKEISHERLEANPAARTCKEHM